METSFTYSDKNTGFFSSTELRWIKKVKEWAEKYPDHITIIRQPEDNDGCIYCKLSPEFFTMRPKKVWSMTAEERAAITERFRLARNSL